MVKTHSSVTPSPATGHLQTFLTFTTSFTSHSLEGWGLNGVICAGAVNQGGRSRRLEELFFSTLPTGRRIDIPPDPRAARKDRTRQDGDTTGIYSLIRSQFRRTQLQRTG